MKRTLLPYLLLTAVAILLLLLSQGIWIVGSVQQENEYRQERFQEKFDRAVSFSIHTSQAEISRMTISELLGRISYTRIEVIGTDEPSIDVRARIEEMLANETLRTTPHIRMEMSERDPDDLGRGYEDNFLLFSIQHNLFDLSVLDSLIQNRSKELGHTTSARLVLRDDMQNTTLDSISHTSGHTRRFFTTTYIAERTVTSRQSQFTIRAEYQIAPQGNALRMSIAMVISAVASVVIILALLLLGRTLKRKHDELQELQASFDGAIHDLKSPLAYTYASLTALEESIDTPQKKMAVAQSADRVLFLSEKIALMLHSSRNLKEVSENEQEEVFVYDIVEQVCVEIRALFPSKKIEFENTIDSEFSLFAAPFLFEAVVRILLENAVRHNENAPIVTVTGIKNGNDIRITITDNGKGIAKRRLKGLFKPYRTSDKVSGTGIGLYYAHTIVKAHGGTLSVESEEGKGSTFTIVIPYKRIK